MAFVAPMIDPPFPVSLADGFGTVALGVAVVWMIATGRLLTRREANNIIRDRDDWKAAHSTSEVARHEALRQNNEFLEHARITDALLGGLSQVSNREHPS